MQQQQRMAASSNSSSGKEEEDRISGLPDHILYHILSFSADHTREVVGTSVLSKRWRYVWTSVPTITISDSHLYATNYTPELMARFMDFVDRVLLLNVVSCLRKFKLDCWEFYEEELETSKNSRFIEWINAAVARNTEDIELVFNSEQEVELPLSFFTCNKVIVLELSIGIDLNVPSSVKLCNLKTLRLYEVYICNEVSMKSLLEGCPVLEELDMECFFYDNMKTLFVKSSSLKRLEIKNTYAGDGLGIVVDATNLERLNLTCAVAEQCELNSLSTLVEVRLDIFCYTSQSDSVVADVHGNKIVELLRKMSNTECMFLSERTMQCLEQARLDNFPMFYYLTRMELEINKHGWQALPYLLECSPFLLSLALTFSSLNDHGELHHHFRKPNCLTLLLQHIELQKFRGCTYGMELVSYFLKNANFLKKLLIGRYYSGSKHVEIIEKLLTFPRSSSACQITII